MVAFLRGINVGGHHKIKMDALRTICARLGLRDAQTLVQSGNIVFRTGDTHVSGQLEDEIQRSVGFRPQVIVRTSADLKRVVARNPFADRPEVNPGKLVVTFLAREPSREARERLVKLNPGSEELRFDGRELYVYYPNGMGRSKLPALIEKVLEVPATARNWNTVTRLLAMAEKLGSTP